MRLLQPGIEKLLIAPLPAGDGDMQLRGTLVRAGATPDPRLVKCTGGLGLARGAIIWYRRASTLHGRDGVEVIVDLDDVLAWEVDAATDIDEGDIAP